MIFNRYYIENKKRIIENGKSCFNVLILHWTFGGYCWYLLKNIFPPRVKNGVLICHCDINNNPDRKLDVVFSRFSSFSFTMILRQWPKGVKRMLFLSVLYTRLCHRVIVNENPKNLQNTNFGILSVLLLNYDNTNLANL